MTLAIITGNPGKQREFQEWLKLPPSVTLDFKDFPIQEIKSLDVEEVAKAKALSVYHQFYQEPFLVEDTGLYFEAYHHFPGAFPKIMFESLGYKGLLKLTEEDDCAYFKSVIAYMDKTLSEPKLFVGITKGKISRTIDDKAMPGFPYDNIFIPEGATTTNSRLTFEALVKNNHRAKSITLFSDFYTTYAQTIT
jgi:non-canonical purine NTP pyrophosphatase (RdgB/HAM1 family)